MHVSTPPPASRSNARCCPTAARALDGRGGLHNEVRPPLPTEHRHFIVDGWGSCSDSPTLQPITLPDPTDVWDHGPQSDTERTDGPMPEANRPRVRELAVRTATVDDLPRLTRLPPTRLTRFCPPISGSNRSVPRMKRRSTSWTAIWSRRARTTSAKLTGWWSRVVAGARMGSSTPLSDAQCKLAARRRCARPMSTPAGVDAGSHRCWRVPRKPLQGFQASTVLRLCAHRWRL